MKGNDANRPKVREADVVVTLVDRFLSKMRPWILIGTILAICLVIYALAYVVKRNS